MPRAVGNAVVRNKIKRQLRELWSATRIERVAATPDYVLASVPGLPEAAEANGHAWLVERVDEVFGKAGDMKAVAILPIRAYQLVVSPWLPGEHVQVPSELLGVRVLRDPKHGADQGALPGGPAARPLPPLVARRS